MLPPRSPDPLDLAALLPRVALGFLAGVLLLGLQAQRTFRGLDRAESFEQAQAARVYAESGRLGSRVLAPLNAAGRARPELMAAYEGAPLYPLLAGRLLRDRRVPMRLQGVGHWFTPELRLLAPLSVMCAALTGVLVLLVGRLLAGSWAGDAAAVLYLCSGAVQTTVNACDSLVLAGLLGTAGVLAALLTVRVPASRGFARILLASASALALVAAILANGMAWSFVPVAGLCLAAEGDSVRPSWASAWTWVLVLAVALALGFGWGWPRWTVALWAAAGGDAAGDVRVATVLAELLVRLGGGWFAALADLFGPEGFGLAGGLLLLALLQPSRADLFSRARWAVLAGAALGGLTGLLCRSPVAGLHVGLLCAVGAAGVTRHVAALQESDPEWPVGVWAGVLCIGVLPLVMTITAPPARSPYPPYYPPLQQYAAEKAPDGILVTDIPEAMAWYTGRASAALPADPAQLTAAVAAGQPLAGVYLTGETINRLVPEGIEPDWAGWYPVVHGQVPTGFPFRVGLWLPPGSREQLLLLAEPAGDGETVVP